MLFALVGTLCLIYFLTPSESSSLRELQDFTPEEAWENPEKRNRWDNYKKEFLKTYSTMSQEREAFENWNRNSRTAKSSSKQTWEAGETVFSDLSSAQFKEILTSIIPQEVEQESQKLRRGSSVYGSPASVDWRTQGKVTPVKYQGSCGSCWAFASIAAIESLQLIQGKGQADYSEQHLVDCTKGLAYLNGCGGGAPALALDWVVKNGITSETTYPYRGNDYDRSKCPNPSRASFSIGGRVLLPFGDIEGLKVAVSKQPVIGCVDASNWQNYKSGIFNTCGTSSNHVVLIVGYTSDYWIVKNSWGTQWGEQGYIRLKMGNTCGLANYPVYPKGVVASSEEIPNPPENKDDERCEKNAQYWITREYCTTNKWIISNLFFIFFFKIFSGNCPIHCKEKGFI